MERYSGPPGGRAGFVLTGGRSSRMGQDKALLPFQNATLGSYVAAQVAAAAGSATLIGDPERHGALGYPVLADMRPGFGPLGGVETALRNSSARWNLVVACDMPRLTPAFLLELLTRAERAETPCFAPVSPRGGPEPLCAVWRSDVLPMIMGALDRNIRKMAEVLEILHAVYWRVEDASWFENVNTPEDWADHRTASPAAASRE